MKFFARACTKSQLADAAFAAAILRYANFDSSPRSLQFDSSPRFLQFKASPRPLQFKIVSPCQDVHVSLSWAQLAEAIPWLLCPA